ncbi:MAG TPA: hypothetical protein VJA46_10060 [Acidimicrobiia bacterium]|nr:hypothetical protein [Acidimicrobiia bacterium]
MGRSWAAREVGQGVETVGGAVVETFHQVSVAVHRHLDRGVSKAGLDGLRVLAGGDQPGGVGVSQVMDPARLADSLRDCRAPDPAERSPPQVAASFGGPHQPVDERVPVDVLSDRLEADTGEGDGAL